IEQRNKEKEIEWLINQKKKAINLYETTNKTKKEIAIYLNISIRLFEDWLIEEYC
ncbi:unnamed protein product, partial [marine sediment metagenome]